MVPHLFNYLRIPSRRGGPLRLGKAELVVDCYRETTNPTLPTPNVAESSRIIQQDVKMSGGLTYHVYSA